MAKIMLVDDAAFMRMMIKKALSSSGYVVKKDGLVLEEWFSSN